MEGDLNINVFNKQIFSKNKYLIQLQLYFLNKTWNKTWTFNMINSWGKDCNVKYAV